MKLYNNGAGNIWTSTVAITAALSKVTLEEVVVSAEEIQTKEFKAKSPSGKFPFLETEQGTLFESAAIARYIARKGDNKALLGSSQFETSLVDQWIDFAKAALFPKFVKIYVATFGLVPVETEDYNTAVKELKEQIKIIDSHLNGKDYFLGSQLTVADIVVFTTLVVPFQVALDAGFAKAMPHAAAWFNRIAKVPEVAKRLGNIKIAGKVIKPIAPPKKEAPKPVAAVKKEEEAPKKKEENPLDVLPPTSFDLFNFKTFFVNHPDKKGEAVDEFFKQYDAAGYSVWYLQYDKYAGEGEVLYQTVNLMNGFLQRIDHFRKHAFAMHAVLGDEPKLEVEGVWLFRGKEIPAEMKDHPQFEYYKTRELDFSKDEDKNLLREFWGAKKEGTVNGMKVQECKFHK